MQTKEKRKAFGPAVLYMDTCPHNEAFWKDIFGTYLETKLGLFHLLHPIMDTLNSKCELYWKSVVKLRNAIYTYFVEDEAALLGISSEFTWHLQSASLVVSLGCGTARAASVMVAIARSMYSSPIGNLISADEKADKSARILSRHPCRMGSAL